uniref:Uncharacterized protein n=1 Tax=Pyxicephalus adspersus TaxID=30357 RepID=A0AAV3AG14_PYXAD|nr:TPA: hypothetical protein GDO54_006304 [Pyxicephalus adspersus]
MYVQVYSDLVDNGIDFDHIYCVALVKSARLSGFFFINSIYILKHFSSSEIMQRHSYCMAKTMYPLLVMSLLLKIMLMSFQ